MSQKVFTKPFTISVMTLGVVAGVSSYVWAQSYRPKILEIYVFDTKGYPSVFIRTPNDKRILINGGANGEVVRHLTKILPTYSKRIDILFLTNDGENKVTGLLDILQRYDVSEVVVSGVEYSTSTVSQIFIKELIDRNIKITRVQTGDVLNIDDVHFDFVFPSPSSVFKYSKASPPDLVFTITYGNSSVLFLGDVSLKIQKTILIDKVGTIIFFDNVSTDRLEYDLMNKLRPEYVVFSKSSLVSSSKKKVDALPFLFEDKRFNIKENGTIRYYSDGSKTGIGR